MGNLQKDIWFEMSVIVQNIGLDDVDQQLLKIVLFDDPPIAQFTVLYPNFSPKSSGQTLGNVPPL